MSASSLLLPGSNKINPSYLPNSQPSDIITSPLQINSPNDSQSAIITVGDGPGDLTLTTSSGSIALDSEGQIFLSSGGDITLIPENGSNVVINSSDSMSSATLYVDNTTHEFAIKTEHNGQDIDLVPGSGKVYVWQNGPGSKAAGGVLSNTGTGLNVECTDGVALTVGNDSVISANTATSITLGSGSNTMGVIVGGVNFQLGSSTVALDDGGNVTCNKTIVDAVQLGTKCEVIYGPATNPSLTQIELISTDGVFAVSNKVATGIVYDTQFNPIFRGKGQGTLATTGIPQAVISCPGITSTDVVLLTPVWDGATPKGMIQIGAVTPANGTFDVISSDSTDNDANFMWAVIIA